MRVFEEIQAFRQWWVLLILGLMLAGSCLALINSFNDSESITLEIIAFGIVVIISFLFWIIKLHTKIDSKGIKAQFRPGSFFLKKFKWNEISHCYVRRYSALTEYGGWGIRGLRASKAYNVSGNMGIQIITKDQKNFLIGTNKPEEAKRVLKRYQEKLQQK